MKKLTIKQEKFANLYVELGNASEAYRQAYDVGVDTTEGTINVKASRLLKESKISLRVESLREELKKKHDVSQNRLIGYHIQMIEAWEELWELGKKANKTKDETQRFYLLKEMVKGSDYRGSIDSIAKMTGQNGTDKVETKDTSHKTEWG